MDNLPSEIKLQIINFLPLESVKLVMCLNKDLWNLCHSSSHWKNARLKISHRNIQMLLEKDILLQCWFSFIHSVVVYTSFITHDLLDRLMVAIASSKVKCLKLIGIYNGSWRLFSDTMKTISVVDMTLLRRSIYVSSDQ